MSSRSIFRPRVLLSISAVVVLLALWFVLGAKRRNVQAATPSNSAASGRPPAPVVVASVEQRDIPVQVNAIGNVQAYQAVQIKSLVNGQIDRVYFKEGDTVRKGQLLFTLDKRPFQADLEKALGAMRKDQAQAENSRAQAQRYTALEQQGVIAREQAEQMRTQAAADASLVYADQAAVDAARVQLGYTDIRAPIDSRAGAVLPNVGNVGNLVKANDTTYLVQLNQITPIYVAFSIPEPRLNEVRQYSASGRLKVLAYPNGQPSNAAEGHLTFIDNGVDPQTGMVALKATFPNADRRLWPGQFVNVVLNLSTVKNATVVPTKAVQSGQQGDYVYVVTSQNTAEARNITPSGTFHDLTLVAQGLSPGERVVVNGQLRVVPNGKVVVQNASAVTNGTSAPGAAGGSL